MNTKKTVLAMLMVMLMAMLVACSGVTASQQSSTSHSNDAMMEEESDNAMMEEKDGETVEEATMEEKMDDDSIMDDSHSDEAVVEEENDAMAEGAIMEEKDGEMYNHLTTSNFIRDIVNHPALKDFRLLLRHSCLTDFSNYMLPRDDNTYYYDTPLNNVGSLMPYHSHVESDIVVGAISHMIDEVNDGKTISYDFYTNEQKQQDPNKRNTGLFFFRGDPNAPFAIVSPGGGFSYVGSLHEGFTL